MQEYDVIIIGGGPGGATAALYTARADLKTIVLDKSLYAGALGMTNQVDNYPGVPNSTGPEIVTIIRKQAESFGAEFKQEQVIGIFGGETKQVYTSADSYEAKAIIVATGTMGRSNYVPGEEALIGYGVSYCATCDAAFFRDQEVAVIGNNEQAFEESLFLTKFASKVMIVHQGKPKASHEILEEIAEHNKISLLPGRMTKVNGEKKVESITVVNGNQETLLQVTGVFPFLQGNKPVTDFLNGIVPLNVNGYIDVDDTFQTSVPGIYAIGDLLGKEIKQAVIAASEGCQVAIHVEKKLRNRKKVKNDWK